MPAREIDFASADGISWSTAIAFTIFHVLAVVALFNATWGAVLVAAGAALDLHRLGHRPRLPPAPHAPLVQDAEDRRVLLRHLRHDDAAGRADLLDGAAPHPPPEVRPRRRPAHAARRQVVVAHAVDHLRRGAARRHGEPGEVLARPDEGPLLPGADPVALGAAGGPGSVAASPSAACRGCCGASSCASSSACTAPGRSTR